MANDHEEAQNVFNPRKHTNAHKYAEENVITLETCQLRAPQWSQSSYISLCKDII